MRKRICILSFSHIIRDGRVLRQIEFLAPHYDLSVIGFGQSPRPDIEWLPIDHPLTGSDKIRVSLGLVFARIFPQLYDYVYWHQPPHQQARAYLKEPRWDAFLADEWKALTSHGGSCAGESDAGDLRCT